MKRSMLTFSAGAVVALVALAACSSDSTSSNGTPTNAEIKANARQAAGAGAATTVNQLDLGEAAAGARIVSGTPTGAAVVSPTTVNCSGPDSNAWYTCNASLENGLTVVRMIRFWTGTSYDLWWNYPSPTDSVNLQWTADGTLTGVDTGKVITVADSSHGTLSVLRPPVIGEQHSWTGQGGAHHVASWMGDNNVERILTQTGSDSVNAVVFQMPRDQNPYPLSGSIVLNFTGNFTAGSYSQTGTQRFVVTFNGTNIATLQDGGITCDLLLDPPHTVSNCH